MFMVKKKDISSHTYKDRHYEVCWACTKETKKEELKKQIQQPSYSLVVEESESRVATLYYLQHSFSTKKIKKHAKTLGWPIYGGDKRRL